MRTEKIETIMFAFFAEDSANFFLLLITLCLGGNLFHLGNITINTYAILVLATMSIHSAE
jgi:hypothetical protein